MKREVIMDYQACPVSTHAALEGGYCRLFPKGAPQDAGALTALGRAMTAEADRRAPHTEDGVIPAGYTYLGQFISHDLSFMGPDSTGDETASQMLVAGETAEPAKTGNLRAPKLDLEMIYGAGPHKNPELYADDRVHLKIGRTSEVGADKPGGPLPGGLPCDVPRHTGRVDAIVHDIRDDQNLAIAQTHVAFLTFHNARVDAMARSTGLSGDALFEVARQDVMAHYRRIIMTDFLPRLVDPNTLSDVRRHGRQFYTDAHKGQMPVEFSIAAYRFGHGMVRGAYDWNGIFCASAHGACTLSDVFRYSSVSGTMNGSLSLPSNRIIDWRRFYDFPNLVKARPRINRARKIGADLTPLLAVLPQFRSAGLSADFVSLAQRDLLRARAFCLPSGQEVHAAMQAKSSVRVRALTEAQILDTPLRDCILAHGFHTETPLWFYLLREAQIFNDGCWMGDVGSRIVAEVFTALSEDASKPFSMSDLLTQANIVNPLGA